MSPRTIDAKAILKDIRAGMDDDWLMAKHKLSRNELSLVIGKLLEARKLDESEVKRRYSKVKKFIVMNRLTRETIVKGNAESLAQLLESAAKDKISLANANLEDASLEKINLAGADLAGANLSNARLFKADLTQANLSNANLYKANLNNADLTRAELAGAQLIGADLTRANLTTADLLGANLTGANLMAVQAPNANLVKADLTGANLVDANFAYAGFQGANLSGTNQTGTNFEGVNLLYIIKDKLADDEAERKEVIHRLVLSPLYYIMLQIAFVIFQWIGFSVIGPFGLFMWLGAVSISWWLALTQSKWWLWGPVIQTLIMFLFVKKLLG